MAFTALVAAVAFSAVASAQTVEDFYEGRTVTVIIPTSPGGLFDLSGRLVAHHIGRFIPGNPPVVAKNMPDGGGLATANAFSTTAPRDGSVIAIVQRSVPQLAIQGDPEAKFDPLAFNWLGSLSSFSDDASMIVIKATHPAMTATDLRKPGISARLGSDGPGTTQYLFAVIAKKVLGLNIFVVPTYSGSVSIFKDMDAGKLDGQVIGLNSIRASQPALWASKTLRPVVQFGRARRHPDLADVPTMRELTIDPKALAIIEFAEQPFLMALPFMAPPGVPANRAVALQEAVRDHKALGSELHP